jgi:hypothetical protein
MAMIVVFQGNTQAVGLEISYAMSSEGDVNSKVLFL